MRAGQRTRDEWLALRCQAAEPGAFEALFAELERPLFVYLLHLVRQQDLALELLQETWMQALRSFGKLKDPSSVRAWCYTLAHGIAVDHLRREQVRHRAEEGYAVEEETNVEPDLTSFDGGGRAGGADAARSRSPRSAGSVLFRRLPHCRGCRHRGLSAGTVKSRLHHAKAQLKHILLEKGYGSKSTLSS